MPFVGLAQLAEQFLDVFLFQFTRAQFRSAFFGLDGQLIFVLSAQSVDQGTDSQPGAAFQAFVFLGLLRFGQLLDFLDDFLRDNAIMQETFQCEDASQRGDLTLADLLNQQFRAVFRTAGAQGLRDHVLQFLLLFWRGRTILDVGDLVQFVLLAHSHQLDQTSELVWNLFVQLFAHTFADLLHEFLGQLNFVLSLLAFVQLTMVLAVAFHVEFLISSVPVQCEDHVGIGWNRTLRFGDRLHRARFHQNQGLVDISDDGVGLFVEWHENVFTVDAGGFDQESLLITVDHVFRNSARFQEFLVFVVFRIASWAIVGETEIVFDLRAFLAVFEVDALGDVQDGLRGAMVVGQFQNRVFGFAFAFQGFLHDAVELCLVVAVGSLSVGKTSFFGHVQTTLLLQVDLEQIEHTTFNVGAPWVFLRIESDVVNQTAGVGEFQRAFQFLLQMLLDLNILERVEWHDFTWIRHFAVQFAHADVVQLEQHVVLTFERDSDHGLNAVGRVLFAGASDTSGQLAIVEESVFAALTKLGIFDFPVRGYLVQPVPFFDSTQGEARAEEGEQEDFHYFDERDSLP